MLRRLVGRGADRQRGLAEVGVAVTGAALVLGAAVGSGVASTVVSMSDGVTWLPDDATGQVVQINPATGSAERRLQIGEPGSELEISQRDGHLVIGDASTGTITSIDLSTLLAGGQRQTDEPSRVLVGGGLAFLVTPSTGVVRIVDPLTLRDLASPYRGAVPFADVVVDGEGEVWVVDRDGELRSLTWDRDAQVLKASEPRPVRGAGAATRLVPHERGVTVFAPDGGAVLQAGVGRDLAVAVPQLDGEVLPAVTSPNDLAPASLPGRSAVVMLSGDRVLDVEVGALGCERPGSPAVFAGRVYVPCTGAGRVIVLRPDGSRGGPDVIVPGGRDPRLLVDDGRLVVFTEDGSRAVLVEADGSSRQIDTGRSGAPVQDPASGSGGAPVVMPPPRQTSSTSPERAVGNDPGSDASRPGDVTPPRGGPGQVTPPTTGGTRPGTGSGTGGGTGAGGGGRPDADAPGQGTVPPADPDVPDADPDEDLPEDEILAPQGVLAELGPQQPDGTSDATVSWSSARTPPERYLVRAPGVAPVEVAGTATSATLRSLACATTVAVTVEAVAGTQVVPAPATSVRTPACPPEAPAPASGVGAVAGEDGSVTVSWTPSTSTVDSYLVGPQGGSTTSVGAGSTSVVLRDLPAGTGLRFVVQAVRDGLVTSSEPSNEVVVAGVPGPVGGLGATMQGRTADAVTVDVSWSGAAGQGSTVTGYTVSWSGGGASGSTAVAGTSTTLGVGCAGQPLCTSGGTLTVTVTARNGVGEGGAASTTVAVPAPPPPPPANGDVVVSHVHAGTPDRYAEEIPMSAELNPPQSWREHTGGCELVVDGVGSPIACSTSGPVHLGGFIGPGSVSVSVRALGVNGATVTSAGSAGDIPPRNNWGQCDRVTNLCTEPVSLEDPEVVVVPLPWTPVPGAPGGPDRPPLMATGFGLLLAAWVLRTQRTTGRGLRPDSTNLITEETP
ncbi:fibronectin type III domain-containing protein [Actinotalea sp. BY-33]|uniref:Fibronectin type III domain-containing protein n=1 Tax=Actinotalea soli TaxID=2819234 RepID=A0A939RU18_9CELL|nr:fibronectin type III domain-containing protein [Actinotalea soli]MBO1750790.1 fibronectin type III domain-containing protein [Actinotalea soli]